MSQNEYVYLNSGGGGASPLSAPLITTAHDISLTTQSSKDQPQNSQNNFFKNCDKSICFYTITIFVMIAILVIIVSVMASQCSAV